MFHGAHLAGTPRPEWLANQHRYVEAETAQLRLYGVALNTKINEAAEHHVEGGGKDAVHQTSLGEIWASPVLRRLLVIAVTLQLAQQLSGINAVVNYSTGYFVPLFPDNPEAADYVTVGMNCGQLLAAIVAMGIIDRGGRRPLLLIGEATMGLALTVLVATSVLGVSVVAAVFVVIFVVGFGFSVGPIPWLIFAELFAPSAVGAASSVCVPANWVTNILVTVTFKSLASLLGDYVFLPFAIFNILFFVFTWFLVPETRGKSAATIYVEMEERLLR